MPNYRQGGGVVFNPVTPTRQNPRTTPVDVRESKQNPVLLGDDESGLIVTRTSDTTPELQFRFPGSEPGQISITDGTTTYGPYAVTGGSANVTDELPNGVYSVIGTAEDSEGNTVQIGGTVEIITGIYETPYELVYE